MDWQEDRHGSKIKELPRGEPEGRYTVVYDEEKRTRLERFISLQEALTISRNGN